MPLPIIPTIGAVASTASALLGQRAQRRAIKSQQSGLDEKYDLARELMEGTRPELASLTQTDLIRRQRAMEDPLADQLRKESMRREATSVGALTAAGPRALAMLSGTQTAAADRMSRINADSENRTQQVLGDVAGREGRIDQYNLGQDQMFRERQAGLEMDYLSEGQNLEGQLAGLRGSGLAAAFSGLATLTGGLPYDSLGMFGDTKRKKKAETQAMMAERASANEGIPSLPPSQI